MKVLNVEWKLLIEEIKLQDMVIIGCGWEGEKTLRESY